MPIFLLSFLTGAKSVFGAILTFFSKPPGSWVGLALILAGAIWGFGQHEYNRGSDACEAAHKAAVASEEIHLVKITAAVTARSEARTAVAKKTDESNRKVLANVTAKARALPSSDAVVIPSDIADELRKIN